jgi:hypothetical protein
MFGSKRLKSAGIISLTLVVAVFIFALSAGETSDVNRHDNSAQAGMPGEDIAGELPDKKEKKIKYWVAPMDPTYIRNEPGKSPMGMDLVPDRDCKDRPCHRPKHGGKDHKGITRAPEDSHTYNRTHYIRRRAC